MHFVEGFKGISGAVEAAREWSCPGCTNSVRRIYALDATDLLSRKQFDRVDEQPRRLTSRLAGWQVAIEKVVAGQARERLVERL